MQERKEINAFVNSWGLKEIDINGKKHLMASIRFLDEDKNPHTFERFLLKKDGTPNKNTLNAAVACGLKSTNFADFIGPGALEYGKEVSLSLKKNDKGYWEVEFVNRLGGMRSVMSDDDARTKIQSFEGLAAINSELNKIEFDQDEELPF